MSRLIFVHLMPSLFEPAVLSGGTAVMADILRASTTITHAVSNGAKRVIPCGTVEEALQIRKERVNEKVLLGGERGGIRIKGFDLSNSPDDYDALTVSNATIGFTTTNGTKALLRSSQAQQSVIGCFANLSKVVELLLQKEHAVHLICAGTNGAITGEDVLFSGAVVDRLITADSDYQLCDSALIALNHWLHEVPSKTSQELETAMLKTQGGRNLLKLNYEKDIKTAAAIDSVPAMAVVGPDGIIAG